MVMSPEFTILAENDRVTSKSEKPEGAITNDFDVRMPFRISKPSFLRIYLFEALSASKRGKLSAHDKKSTKLVQSAIGVFRTGWAAISNWNSSQNTVMATAITNMLLVATPGSIHGLPIQRARVDIFMSPVACRSSLLFLSKIAKRVLKS